MNILIIGGGGREHALAWKISQSPLCTNLYCAPGNPGIAQLADCVSLTVKPDYPELVHWCHGHSIDLVVVGPERPLAEGLVDALQQAGFKAFGPSAAGAELEASKKFAKDLMLDAGIPTATAQLFDKLNEALAWVKSRQLPYVIKAVGLAEGKGVTVAHTRAEAEQALRQCMESRVFGEAGKEVLIEEFLEGEEASLLAFTDGKVIKPMDSAQDHKAVFDGDQGPNTGGMGAYSPAPVVTAEIYRESVERILNPCLDALRKRGIDYRGVVYAGLMVTRDGPKVIEFNCRFGDPETQALLPRLKTDLVEVMIACAEGRLAEVDLQWTSEAAVCVVAASGGYPGDYEKGKVILGLNQDSPNHDAMIFHAGTTLNAKRETVTNGGRVLGVTALDADLSKAIAKAYETIRQISFDGMHYRKDIGKKGLTHHRVKMNIQGLIYCLSLGGTEEKCGFQTPYLDNLEELKRMWFNDYFSHPELLKKKNIFTADEIRICSKFSEALSAVQPKGDETINTKTLAKNQQWNALISAAKNVREKFIDMGDWQKKSEKI